MSCVAGGGGGGVGHVLSWRLKSAAEPTITNVPCCLLENKRKELDCTNLPKMFLATKRLFVRYQMRCKSHNCKTSDFTSHSKNYELHVVVYSSRWCVVADAQNIS